MVCRWCKADNGKTGQSVEARLCPRCQRYGPDESVTDAAGWCDRCGYTGDETTCPNCGPYPVEPGEAAAIREALERAKQREKHADQSPALLRCEDCGGVAPWEDWLDPDAFELCPICGSHNAKLIQQEATDDEVPF